MKNLVNNNRVLGRELAREITDEEMNEISGGCSTSTGTDDGMSCDGDTDTIIHIVVK